MHSARDSAPPTRTEELTGAAHSPVLEFRVTVGAGPDKGKAATSRAARIVIGTHPSADLVLEDKSVSRFHCELAVVDGNLRVRDLGSRNGTRLDGVAVLLA